VKTDAPTGCSAECADEAPWSINGWPSAGGVRSTPTDMARSARALLEGVTQVQLPRQFAPPPRPDLVGSRIDWSTESALLCRANLSATTQQVSVACRFTRPAQLNVNVECEHSVAAACARLCVSTPPITSSLASGIIACRPGAPVGFRSLTSDEYGQDNDGRGYTRSYKATPRG